MIENKQREVVLIADSFAFLRNFAISDTRLRRPFFPIREIARPVRHARLGLLASDQRNFLIGTAKLSEFALTTREMNHLTFSNRDKFSSLPPSPCAALRASRSSSACSSLATCHLSLLSNRHKSRHIFKIVAVPNLSNGCPIHLDTVLATPPQLTRSHLLKKHVLRCLIERRRQVRLE